MEKSALIIAAVILAFILGMPVHASASWSVSWYENGNWGTPVTHYNLSKYEAFILSDTSGSQLEGLTTNAAGWTSEAVNPAYSVMEGSLTGNLNFSTIFSGTAHNGLVLNFVAWSGDVIVGAEKVTLTGTNYSNYSYQELNIKDANVVAAINSLNRSPVPLPSAGLLLSAGLIGLIGARRKLFA